MIRMIRSMVVLAVLGVGIVATAGCGGKDGAAAQRPPEQGQPAAPVVVAAAATADLQDAVDVVGTLEPKFSTEVKSEISGLVTAVYVTEWVPVRKGDPLARLDTSETEAGIDALKAGVAQAQVAETRAKREYERAQQLKQYGLITPQNLDDAKSALEAAQAATAAAQAQVHAAETRLAKAFIKSPMDGIVALRGVNVGDRVENMGGNTPMFRIVNNGLLDLTVSVPSTRAAAVRVGQTVEFSTDTLPGRTFTGKVMFINPALDEATRSAKVVVEVRNADGALKGGAFVKGRIVVGNRPGVLQVPRDALLNWNVEQQTADVFVVQNNKAEKRTVKTGATAGTSIEILSGLSAGDPVVTRGAFSLKPGDNVVVSAGQGV